MGAPSLKRLAGGSFAFALAACATTSPPPPPPKPTVEAPAPVAAPPAPKPAADQCGLSELDGLVGRPTTEIPIPLEPGRRRVVCETCPRTMEFAPNRQTVLFDAATGRVTSVACG